MAEFVIQVQISASSPREAVELIGNALYDADLKRDWAILGGDRTSVDWTERNGALLREAMAGPPITEQIARGFVPFDAPDT